MADQRLVNAFRPDDPARIYRMKLPYFEVAAFTRRPFGGNPAGVCLLEERISDALMQSIATENNLAETAFVVPENGGYRLQWFTPVAEIDLCGHATLGSAHILVNHRGLHDAVIRFRSPHSGELSVKRDGDRLVLDFPARPVKPSDVADGIVDALRAKPHEVFEGHNYLALFSRADEVRALTPDFSAMKKLPLDGGVIATAAGDDCDFVSRFFVPKHGIDEDHVTGSTHCSLIPFWSERLGKTQMFARQVSQRGGELFCEMRGDRVGIGGHAVTYLTGEIEV